MNCISILRRLGLLPAVFQSEIEAADSEDVVRTAMEHSRALNSVEDAAKQNQRANRRLRESIRRVKSSAFADFERSIGGLRDQ